MPILVPVQIQYVEDVHPRRDAAIKFEQPVRSLLKVWEVGRKALLDLLEEHSHFLARDHANPRHP